MNSIRYTLLGDGSSDRVLGNVIRWALKRLEVRIEQEHWADLGLITPPPKGLAARVRATIAAYPCDVLFLHRDSDKASYAERLDEIRAAVAELAERHVPIITVQMTEAWLLHDEAAIRSASGNPQGNAALQLPQPSQVESVLDPKKVLAEALLTASELSGRRRQKKRAEFPLMRARVGDLIDDFTPLEVAPAFSRFLAAVHSAISE